MFDCVCSALTSSTVSMTWRPARSPPACIPVRAPHTMAMFRPSSISTLSLPRRKPSPVAERMTTEMTPQRMPNIVRKLRSLLARRFATTWRNTSSMSVRENDLVARVDAADDLHLRAVADAGLYGDARAAGPGRAVEKIDRGVVPVVVEDRRFRYEQRVGELLEDDLGV